MKKKALIVVNKEMKDQKKRQGATKDYQQMCWMFGELGFKVTPRWNLTASDIKEALRKACSKPCDCFVFVLSSHGQEAPLPGESNVYVYDQTVLGSDGQAVSVKDLFECMDTLKETPKLCFIQACRSKPPIQTSSRNDTDEMIINRELPNLDEGVSSSVCEQIMKDEHTTNKSDQPDGKTTQDSFTQSRTTQHRPWYASVIDLSETITAFVETSEQLKDDDNPFDLPDSDNEDVDDEIDPPAGGGDSNLMPDLPVDVAPVDCPKGCLVMYSVQPHKYALRNPNFGSWMLHYMFENRNVLKNDGNVLVYLTCVAREMANHTSEYDIKNEKKKVIYSANVKICGTIYHRLTTDVILKAPGKLTSQMRAWSAHIQSKWNAATSKK